MTPVYVAAVSEGEPPWISAVEELLPSGLTRIYTESFEARPARPSWKPAPFVSDALLGARLGSPRLRRWWRRLQPDLTEEDPQERGRELILYILDLAILSMISGPRMDFQSYASCTERVLDVLTNHHALLAALTELDLISADPDRPPEFVSGLDLDVYVPERGFIEQTGDVTDEGIAGSNNLVAISEEFSLSLLASPTVDAFLATLGEE